MLKCTYRRWVLMIFPTGYINQYLLESSAHMDDREKKTEVDPLNNTLEQCAASQTLKPQLEIRHYSLFLIAHYVQKLLCG